MMLGIRNSNLISVQSWTHLNNLKANINTLQVNGEVFDLDRVLEGDCTLEFLKFEDDEGKLSLLQILNFSIYHLIFVLLCPNNREHLSILANICKIMMPKEERKQEW